MSNQTNIEWADSTFNPWMGCTKVSPACEHCYAERDTKRFGRVEWGAGKPRARTSAANWKLPERWNRQAETFVGCTACSFRGSIDDWATHRDQHLGSGTIHHMAPARRRVFSASLADWLDNEVPIEWLVDLLDLIRRTPNLDWLLLTKRIGNWRGRIGAAIKFIETDAKAWNDNQLLQTRAWLLGWHAKRLMPTNVWLGATVINQVEADRDVPKLLAVLARVRFLSIEPMLGAINLKHMDVERAGHREWCFINALTGEQTDMGRPCPDVPRLHWIIAGGESGPHARPSHPDWYRSLRDQCTAAGVPFLFKQWGEWAPISQVPERVIDATYRSNRKAAEHEDQDAIDDSYGRTCAVESTCIWLDGSTRPILEPMAFLQGKCGMSCFRVGKKAAGRQLDGRTHDGFPVVQP